MEADGRGGFAALQQLLRKPRVVQGERCDFCAVPVESGHGHLIDLKARRIMCSCRPCWLVFEPKGAAQGRYKPVPNRYVEISDFRIDDAEWDALQIPIALAFFFYNSVEGKMMGFYPGPAGATESLLSLETWAGIAGSRPELTSMEADVEAALIHRRANGTVAFIVPIDSAYELVGIMRGSWKGFDGGEEAWRRIGEFFAELGEKSRGRTTARIT